jgi:nucleoside-diphosphate-sugar epimerase
LQTRSFLYIDDCVDAVRALVKSDFQGPVNIGSEEMISINSFAKLIIEISNKQVQINNISGPQGVRGRNSDNVLMKQMVGWAPRFSLREGMVETYNWVAEQVRVSN